MEAENDSEISITPISRNFSPAIAVVSSLTRKRGMLPSKIPPVKPTSPTRVGCRDSLQDSNDGCDAAALASSTDRYGLIVFIMFSFLPLLVQSLRKSAAFYRLRTSRMFLSDYLWEKCHK
jgi:hypothetical protein